MADSDDEYDRKRRDKFRGERGSGDSYRSERREDRRGGGGGGPGAGGEWPERNPFRGAASAAGGGAGGGAAAGGGRGRPEYFDYRQRFGSPSRERPPAKRMRGDWGDDLRPGPRYGGYDPYLMHAWNEHYAAHSMHAPYAPHPLGHPGAGHGREPPAIMNSDIPTQPPMLTLKQFLEGQDDSISDSEVLNKYAEYKLDFKRTQLNEFFVTHKDAEWFKNKYHPLESSNRRQEHLQYLKNRITVFNELLDNGQIGSVSVDTSQTDPLLRLLDTVVIKLEGGTDEDLKILDEKPKEIVFPEKKIERDDDVIITSVEKKPAAAKDKPEVEVVPRLVSPPPIKRAAAQSDEENWDDDDEPAVAAPKPAEPATSEAEDTEKKPKSKKSLKRKRSHSDSSSSSSNSDSESSSSSSSDDDDDEKVKNYDLESLKKEDDEDEEEKSEPAKVENENSETNLLDEKSNESARAAANDTPTEDEVKPPASPLNDDEESKTDSKPAVDDEDKIDEEPKDEAAAVIDIKKEADADGTVAIDDDDEAKPDAAAKKVEEEPETIDLDTVKDGPQPRPLHRTSSIFLRNLAPHITKAEIEALCTRYDGYLRVAIADPLPERRWYRRGWVTFKRDVNIKEICWNLNNTRIKDCEMGAIVNRDLSRRVRPVNGLTAHKSVVRADIKLCAKLTMLLDEKFKLWMQNNEENHSESTNGNGNGDSGSATSVSAGQSYGFNSKNPVLQNITDFLIEEASAEEEELLGITNENKEGDGEVIERDPQLLSVLDRLILYLRIIHSVDFYNHCEYPYEDEMPNRCGIIHARGPPPSKITQNDIQDYIKNFENKMQTFLAKPQVIEESELKKLGAKDAEEEVEKFIQANTQELAKDKWLCPLSGKKFKGPEFIRKHIFNKHGEKVEEVRKEVEFFNNYLKDPKRPQLPEHPGNTKRTISESSGGGGGFRPPVYPPAYAPPYAAYLPPMMMPGRGRGFGGGVGRRELPMDHQRRIIGYHDLDAPSNFDMFD